MGSLTSLDCPTGSTMEPRSFSPIFRVCMYVCQLNRVVCVVLMLYTNTYYGLVTNMTSLAKKHEQLLAWDTRWRGLWGEVAFDVRHMHEVLLYSAMLVPHQIKSCRVG